jgi:hypothetical protein
VDYLSQAYFLAAVEKPLFHNVKRAKIVSTIFALSVQKMLYFYCFVISWPQHCRGTVHLSGVPESHVQGFLTISSRPHFSHTNKSPAFMSQQLAILISF